MRAKVRVKDKKLIAVRSRAEAAIIESIEDALQAILDLATQLAPVDTGALKTSGELEGKKFRRTVTFGKGLPDIRAIAQEFGTIYHPAQPFLRPAMKAVQLPEIVKGRIKKVIK